MQPQHQRRGFGQAILEHLEGRAGELGFRHLCLDTTAKQLAAQPLYVKNGYRETRRKQMGPFEVIVFEKDLCDDAHHGASVSDTQPDVRG